MSSTPANTGTQGSGAAAPGSRLLLIVEDHPINQLVARTMVASLGYRSDLAADGIEALAALERRSYAAVLMDCHMPLMDGFEATAEIRRCEAGRRHVPIIAMTASTLGEERDKCLTSGMDGFLSKPIDDRELEAMLNHWVRATEAVPPDGDPAGRGVLDPTQLELLQRLAAANSDPRFLADLIDGYVDHAASHLAELREAVARGDARTFRKVAHALKGSSLALGAAGVASACAALEEAGARGEVVGPDGLQTVVIELERATAALQASRPAV